jgi:hypothetical protein
MIVCVPGATVGDRCVPTGQVPKQGPISVTSRIALALMLALGVAACTEPIEKLVRRARDSSDSGRRHPQEPPTFPPVAAGEEDCGECMRNEFGLCRFERGAYCPGLPVEITEECMYEVACDESCCDRFPIVGGVALVRPGARLMDFDDEETAEVARIPQSSRGLLVRVEDIYESEDEDGIVQVEIVVKTLGQRSPSVCTGFVEDLDGVVLQAHVAPSDLQRAPEACRAAVYALGEPDTPGNAYDSKERYKYRFDATPYGDARVIKAWTSIDHPCRKPGCYGNDAGQLFKHIVLDEDEPLVHEDGMLCYRLPGLLRPRVCSRPEAVHEPSLPFGRVPK